MNRSAFSAFFGVPVALIGMMGFLSLAALSTAHMREPRRGLGLLAPPLMSAAVVAGLSMGAYLTFVELFVLKIVCLLCVASLAAFAVAAFALRRSLVLPGLRARGTGRRAIPADGD